jgi:hypothetical protein
MTLPSVHSISQLPKRSTNRTALQTRTTLHDRSARNEKKGRGADGGDVSRCPSTPAQGVTYHPLMRRTNTENTPNKPVTWPRNELLIRYAVTSPVHTVTIRCWSTGVYPPWDMEPSALTICIFCVLSSVYVCVCVCVCVCVYVCMCMHVCTYVYACMYVRMHVCMCVCMYVCMCVYACMYVCVCVYACMYGWMDGCMHVCVGMYVCMCACRLILAIHHNKLSIH